MTDSHSRIHLAVSEAFPTARVLFDRLPGSFGVRILHSKNLEWGARRPSLQLLAEAVETECIPSLRLDAAKLEHAQPLLEQVTADVLLEPFLTVVLVHECIGHSSEADNYDDYAGKIGLRLGQKWTQLPLTVVDDPTRPGHCGSYATDAEGTPSQRVELVADGTWTSLLTSRTHPGLTGSNGHARRHNARIGRPAPRMSFLSVLPGTTNHDSMLHNFSGYRLGGIRGGGSVRNLVVVKPQWAERFHDGKPTGQVLSNLEIRAPKAPLMRRLSAIGNKSFIFDPFHPCSKSGQDIPITMEGPRFALRQLHLYPSASS